jgi:hypothetical protein
MGRILGVMFLIGLAGLAAVTAAPRLQRSSLATFFSGKCLEQAAPTKDCPRKHSFH